MVPTDSLLYKLLRENDVSVIFNNWASMEEAEEQKVAKVLELTCQLTGNFIRLQVDGDFDVFLNEAMKNLENMAGTVGFYDRANLATIKPDYVKDRVLSFYDLIVDQVAQSPENNLLLTSLVKLTEAFLNCKGQYSQEFHTTGALIRLRLLYSLSNFRDKVPAFKEPCEDLFKNMKVGFYHSNVSHDCTVQFCKIMTTFSGYYIEETCFLKIFVDAIVVQNARNNKHVLNTLTLLVRKPAIKCDVVSFVCETFLPFALRIIFCKMTSLVPVALDLVTTVQKNAGQNFQVVKEEELKRIYSMVGNCNKKIRESAMKLLVETSRHPLKYILLALSSSALEDPQIESFLEDSWDLDVMTDWRLYRGAFQDSKKTRIHLVKFVLGLVLKKLGNVFDNIEADLDRSPEIKALIEFVEVCPHWLQYFRTETPKEDVHQAVLTLFCEVDPRVFKLVRLSKWLPMVLEEMSEILETSGHIEPRKKVLEGLQTIRNHCANPSCEALIDEFLEDAIKRSVKYVLANSTSDAISEEFETHLRTLGALVITRPETLDALEPVMGVWLTPAFLNQIRRKNSVFHVLRVYWSQKITRTTDELQVTEYFKKLKALLKTTIKVQKVADQVDEDVVNIQRIQVAVIKCLQQVISCDQYLEEMAVVVARLGLSISDPQLLEDWISLVTKSKNDHSWEILKFLGRELPDSVKNRLSYLLFVIFDMQTDCFAETTARAILLVHEDPCLSVETFLKPLMDCIENDVPQSRRAMQLQKPDLCKAILLKVLQLAFAMNDFSEDLAKKLLPLIEVIKRDHRARLTIAAALHSTLEDPQYAQYFGPLKFLLSFFDGHGRS